MVDALLVIQSHVLKKKIHKYTKKNQKKKKNCRALLEMEWDPLVPGRVVAIGLKHARAHSRDRLA